MEKNNIRKKDLTDFPFEDVPNKNWALSLLVAIGGFFYISFGIWTLPKILVNEYFISFLFLFFCLVALSILDNKFFNKIFKKINSKDLLIIIFTLVICYGMGFISSLGKTDLVENPITGIINKSNIVKILIVTAIQLIGEEILFVIPFLYVYNKMKIKKSKRISIIVAWIISSLFFGALHLPTYSFNFYQAFIVIGTVRMGMSISYILTKNLTVSYIAHVLYDFLILIGVYLVGEYMMFL
ncbi:CPBP family intramembrane glutamic endopeptidase [Peptoniphilus stercorisuis]|uniref:Membrane protease YdiL (CAAX protease family) n=1 Tax=Peptoniphilus stercorisuis TaxID=1436965 RepID=A0ABS4KDM5_9FIRM|nr:CPBP family intramembrane glutamic endopeptidase [Peptoniphilus stercorisuis]MBP2025863.1 membrane protease YdiL (CAAX protease family) [Peptoniphilus stercorisuis]